MGGAFACVGWLLKFSFQNVEPDTPERPHARQPDGDLIEPFCIEFIYPPLSFDARSDKPCFTQCFEMLRDRRCACVEASGDVARTQAAACEHFNDLPAGWIGEGGERLHASEL